MIPTSNKSSSDPGKKRYTTELNKQLPVASITKCINEVLTWIRFTPYYPAMAMVCMKHRVLYFTKVVDNDRIPCHRCKPFPRQTLLPKLRLGCVCTAAGHSATAGTAGTARQHVKGSAMAAHGNMREWHSWVSDECDQMGCKWMQVSLLKTWGVRCYQDSLGHLGEAWIDPR